MPANLALFNEFNNTGGSLFSIHSAPLVQLGGDLGTITAGGHIISQNDCNDLSRRPISLALESQQNLSTKSVLLELSANNNTKRNGDIDEEDTDNLLTVSSVTARPLIAKSRELRTSK